MSERISKDTILCISLAGRPGNHGTRFHNFLYRELGLNYVYKAFTTQDLEAALNGVRALGIRGCSISMPFKEVCIPFLDEMDPSAAAIQAVNTIVNDDGRLRGYNTDYIAVLRLLDSGLVDPRSGFALRGSGGMAKAVACALRDAGFRTGCIIARNEMTGRSLAQASGYQWQPKLGSIRPSILVNATPIGMAGSPEEAELAFTPDVIRVADTIFDVVAHPPETPLIRQARKEGKQVITGTEVIALQALEQFVLYTGVRPTDEQVKRAAAYARESIL